MSKREFEYGDPCYCDQCSASSWHEDRIEERTTEVGVAVKLAHHRGWRMLDDEVVCFKCSSKATGSLRNMKVKDFDGVIECDTYRHLAIECGCGECIECDLTSLTPPDYRSRDDDDSHGDYGQGED